MQCKFATVLQTAIIEYKLPCVHPNTAVLSVWQLVTVAVLAGALCYARHMLGHVCRIQPSLGCKWPVQRGPSSYRAPSPGVPLRSASDKSSNDCHESTIICAQTSLLCFNTMIAILWHCWHSERVELYDDERLLCVALASCSIATRCFRVLISQVLKEQWRQ